MVEARQGQRLVTEAPPLVARTGQRLLSLEQVQPLIDALPFYVLLIDEQHCILAVNQASVEGLKRTPEQILGHYCPQVVHGCDGPYAGCPLEEARDSDRPVVRTLHEHDPERHILSSVYPTGMIDDRGLRVYLHYAQDVTEVVQGREELQRSIEQHLAMERLLRHIQSAADAEAVLTLTIEELLGLSWMGLQRRALGFLVDGNRLRRVVGRNLPDEDCCRNVRLGECLCGAAARSGQLLLSHSDDARHTRPASEDGEQGHLVLPVRYHDDVLAVLSFYLAAPPGIDPFRRQFLEAVGSVAGVALHQLRTSAKLLERHTRQMQLEKLAALGKLVAGVAHEVNNPLAGLKSILWRLRREDLEPAKKQQYLALMDDGLEHIARVVQQLLDFTRIRPPQSGRESVLRLVEATRELLPDAEPTRGVRLCLELQGAEEIHVAADLGQIRQALTNLLLNAYYVTPEGGEVQVGLQRRAGLVGIAVRDHGPGIPEEIRNQIENPFFSTKPEGEGTGLGLSITRTIAETHQGDLTFSFPDDGGTVATLWLPLIS